MANGSASGKEEASAKVRERREPNDLITSLRSKIYKDRATLMILGGGAFGGIVDVITRQPTGNPSAWSVIFHAMVGTMAAIILNVAVDSRRRDLLKLLAISFVAGFSWDAVLNDARHRFERENTEANGGLAVDALKKEEEQNETTSSDVRSVTELTPQEIQHRTQIEAWAYALDSDPEASLLLQSLASADREYEDEEAERTLSRLGLIDDRYLLDGPVVTSLGSEIASVLRRPDSSLPMRPDSARRSQVAIVGDTVAGSFLEYADEWYRFEIDMDSQYVIATLPDESGQIVDTELVLFDSALRPLSADDDCGPGTLSRMAQALPNGAYLLQVSSFFATPGSYGLTIERQDSAGPACESYFPMESMDWSAADTVEAGDTVPATFDGDDGDHLYALQVRERGFFVISTSGSPTGPDTVVRLYDEQGQVLLGYDDDGGDVPRYSALRRFLEEGVYGISVSSYGGRVGSYELSIGTTAID